MYEAFRGRCAVAHASDALDAGCGLAPKPQRALGQVTSATPTTRCPGRERSRARRYAGPRVASRSSNRGLPALLLESPATHVDWAPDGARIVFTVETSDGKSESGWPTLTAPTAGSSSTVPPVAVSPTTGLAGRSAKSPSGGATTLHRGNPCGSWTLTPRRRRSRHRVRQGHRPRVPGLVPEKRWPGLWWSWTTTRSCGATRAGPSVPGHRLDARGPRPTDRHYASDGSRIAFDAGNLDPFSGTGLASNIWTVAPDGTALAQVTHQADDEDWVPTGASPVSWRRGSRRS